MSEQRTKAHEAMRELWGVANPLVAEIEPREFDGHMIRNTATEGGAEISRIDDTLKVVAEFEKPDGTDETIIVLFPQDIRDLSVSEVEIYWSKDGESGTNTPKLRDYPGLAKSLIELC